MQDDLGSFAAMWAAMCVVMMAPTATRPMLRIAGGDAVKAASFLTCYLAVWIVLALPAYPIAGRMWSGFALFAGWIIVGAYQMLPSTSRLMRSCRSLRIGGPASVSGLRYGLACAAACAPLMIVAMATLHTFQVPLVVAVLAMAGVTAFIMWEKAPRVPLMAVRLSGTAMIIVAALAFTVVAPSTHEHGDAAQVIGTSRS